MTPEQQVILDLKEKLDNLCIELNDINENVKLLLAERSRNIAKENDYNQSFGRSNYANN